MLMYNRKPVLPIDVKHILDKDESNEREHKKGDGDEEQFDLNFFDAIFSSATKVRTTIADKAAENIKATRKNKNMLIIVDIYRKLKLRWMTSSY